MGGAFQGRGPPTKLCLPLTKILCAPLPAGPELQDQSSSQGQRASCRAWQDCALGWGRGGSGGWDFAVGSPPLLPSSAPRNRHHTTAARRCRPSSSAAAAHRCRPPLPPIILAAVATPINATLLPSHLPSQPPALPIAGATFRRPTTAHRRRHPPPLPSSHHTSRPPPHNLPSPPPSAGDPGQSCLQGRRCDQRGQRARGDQPPANRAAHPRAIAKSPQAPCSEHCRVCHLKQTKRKVC